jgi:hypothetical protein
VVVTAKELTEEDQRRLAEVRRVIGKGELTAAKVLDELPAVLDGLGAEAARGAGAAGGQAGGAGGTASPAEEGRP